MDQEPPTADLGAKGGGALDHVFQHPCTQTTPFVLDTDAKSRQQSNRLRIPSSSLPQPLRGGLHSDACHAPCVIADDLHAVWLRDHQDLRRTGSSRLTGVSSEPLSLLHGTTLEALHHVVVGQQRRRQVSVGHPVAKGEARFISLRSPGRSRDWRLLMASQTLATLGDMMNSVRSASTRRAAVVTLLTTNAVRSVPTAATARSMRARSSGVVLTSKRSLRRRFATVGMYGQCTSYGDEWQPRCAYIRSQHDCSHRPLSALPRNPLVEGAFALPLNRPMGPFAGSRVYLSTNRQGWYPGYVHRALRDGHVIAALQVRPEPSAVAE